MASFNPKPIDLLNINNGQQYTNNDGVDAQAINDTIEAAAYASEIVDNTPVDLVYEGYVAELVARSVIVGSVSKAQDPDVDIRVENGQAVMDFVLPTVGRDGAPGADGTTFTPSVSSAGVISWTNDGGEQNPPSVDLVAAVVAALPVYDGTGD